MQSKIDDHEKRIAALESVVHIFRNATTADIPQRGSKAESTIPLSKRWAFKYLDIPPQIRKSVPEFFTRVMPKDWPEINNPEEATLVILIAFASGGRADVAKYKTVRKPGQKLVGIILHPGRNSSVLWPMEVFPVDVSFSFHLNDSWEDIANSNENDMVLSDFRSWLLGMNLYSINSCVMCGTNASSTCGLECNTSYCNQECAQRHWKSGHSAHHK